MNGSVVAVSVSATHSFSKPSCASIRLVAGHGVEGDAHAGATVKHRSRVARDPNQPNLRQVHLLDAEVLDELQAGGFSVPPGALGENITTRAVGLLQLPSGTRLHLGQAAIVEITGLRNPCSQLDDYQEGLMAALLDRDDAGKLVRKAGVMGVVRADGDVQPGDSVRIELPPAPHNPLEPV